MTKRAPGLMQQSALKALLHLFASGRVWPVFAAVLLLTLLNWFCMASYELLLWLDGQKPVGGLGAHVGIGLAAFPSVLGLMFVLARKARERFHAQVSEEDNPRAVRGLVLFLSALRPETQENLEAALAQGLDFQGFEGFRARFGKANWLMPLKAVDYHASHLSHVVAIASAGDDGSFKQLDLFKQLLKQVFPGQASTLVALEDCFAEKAEKAGFGQGVDFEVRPERLATAANAAYEYLRGQGLRPSDILIDITGGPKVATVVGAAVALAEGRRIQYVSTHDCHVRVYDVSYEP